MILQHFFFPDANTTVAPVGGVAGTPLFFLLAGSNTVAVTDLVVTPENVVWRYKNDRHYPAYDVTAGVVQAEFSWDAFSNPPNVFFTNESIGATSFLWDFASQGSSTDPNPSWMFAFVTDVATFAVSLTINGGASTVVHLVEVSQALSGPLLSLDTLTVDELDTLTVHQLDILPVIS